MEAILNVKEAAEKLSISTYTVRSWIFQKKLPYVRLGRRIGIRPEDIDSFISKNLVKAQERD